MKCPNCGAEIGNSKVCDFCGSQITTEMQRQQEQLNKKGCPKCGSSNITFNREKRGEVKGKSGTAVVRATVGLCKDCGYTWYTDESYQMPKKRKTWLWVLGWLFIFPVPLTIIMLRNRNMKPAIKYGIIAVAWIVYLMFGLASQDKNKTNESKTSTTNTVAESEQADNKAADKGDIGPEELLNTFVSDFNGSSSIKLEYVEDFTPSDKQSTHYRTEFRLNAYADATGKSYQYDGVKVDIVAKKQMLSDSNIRIYMDGATLEQCKQMIINASPIMDKSASDVDIQEAVNYLENHKEANGYYYANLGLVVLGSDVKGYEFMLKMGND